MRGLRALSAWIVAAAGAGGLAVGAAAQEPPEVPFPHEEHAGLFPLCASCHAGAEVAAGSVALYPEPTRCAQCHDGVDEARVTWAAPSTPPSNVRFAHGVHEARVETAGDSALACATCHAPRPDDAWAVQRAVTDSCWTCHAHPATEHYADAECSTCHVPLAETRFPVARVAALPEPPDHDRPDFLAESHGAGLIPDDLARCATCHTQERCTSCHVRTIEQIAAMPVASATLELPPFDAHYPTPASHLEPGFAWAHAPEPDLGATACGTCHTQDDCTSCHVAPIPVPVQPLPSRSATRAPGVGLVRAEPDSHLRPFFATDHGALAAGSLASCSGCHTTETCTQCHDAPRSGGFHPSAFAARHAAEAFGATMDCATCHSTEAFCRACHVEAGLGSTGRLGPGYHDAEPLWLLRHGQPARQALESCAGCHQQRDCLQCHSTTGSFQVSPHGPDFDADRAWERSAPTCLACHVADPRTLPR
ncbi:MAG: hypothetical protein R3E98_06500 [Gemmatimonadota bacterium]|nr:hypothetical protein [Gemmatimonadota bacterium]